MLVESYPIPPYAQRTPRVLQVVNFFPIELTMAVQECDFVAAVHYLESLLLRRPRREAH